MSTVSTKWHVKAFLHSGGSEIQVPTNQKVEKGWSGVFVTFLNKTTNEGRCFSFKKWNDISVEEFNKKRESDEEFRVNQMLEGLTTYDYSKKLRLGFKSIKSSCVCVVGKRQVEKGDFVGQLSFLIHVVPKTIECTWSIGELIVALVNKCGELFVDQVGTLSCRNIDPETPHTNLIRVQEELFEGFEFKDGTTKIPSDVEVLLLGMDMRRTVNLCIRQEESKESFKILKIVAGESPTVDKVSGVLEVLEEKEERGRDPNTLIYSKEVESLAKAKNVELKILDLKQNQAGGSGREKLCEQEDEGEDGEGENGEGGEEGEDGEEGEGEEMSRRAVSIQTESFDVRMSVLPFQDEEKKYPVLINYSLSQSGGHGNGISNSPGQSLAGRLNFAKIAGLSGITTNRIGIITIQTEMKKMENRLNKRMDSLEQNMDSMQTNILKVIRSERRSERNELEKRLEIVANGIKDLTFGLQKSGVTEPYYFMKFHNQTMLINKKKAGNLSDCIMIKIQDISKLNGEIPEEQTSTRYGSFYVIEVVTVTKSSDESGDDSTTTKKFCVAFAKGFPKKLRRHYTSVK